MTDPAPWNNREISRLDRIIQSDRVITSEHLSMFPGRSLGAIHRMASNRRVLLGLSQSGRLRPAPSYEESALASKELHRRTVAMCIRNSICLWGKSAAETKAIAHNLGIISCPFGDAA